MSNHNYSQYSNKNKKKNSDNRNAEPAAQAVHSKPKVEEVKMESIEVEPIAETVETVSLATSIIGTVTNCSKLNVREKPNTDADVLTVLNYDSEIKIDPARSTNEWLKIVTTSGVEGYCMRKFVNAKL